MKLNVEKKFDGYRLDAFLKEKSALSASRIKELLNARQVKVNGKEVWVSKFGLNSGDNVEVGFIAKNKEKVRVLEENEDFLIVYKPAGLSVENRHYLDSPLVDSLQKINSKKYNYNNLGLVHRLDKDTSGIMILARNDKSYEEFLNMFKERKVQKTYLATVWGVPKKESGEIRRNIERDWKEKNKVKIVETGGKEAVTEYKVVKKNGKQSVVECQPKTGRMHQIRVHLASIGCPIVGDKIYGTASGEGLGLQAVRLEFNFKGKDWVFDLREMVEK